MMRKNIALRSGAQNPITMRHFSIARSSELICSAPWLQSLFSKTLQSFLNKDGLVRGNLRVPAAKLANIKSLKRLQASRCKIGDPGVKSLATLPRLEHLDVGQNGYITDASAPYLASMKGLVKLDISSTGLTFLGMRRLKELTRLRKLVIRSNTLTASQKEQLKGMLNPGCKIYEESEKKRDMELFEPLH